MREFSRTITRVVEVVTLAFILVFAVVHSGLASLRDAGEKLIGERAFVFCLLEYLFHAVSTVVYFINLRYDGTQLWELQTVPGVHERVWISNFISFMFLYPSTFNLLEVAAVDKPKSSLEGSHDYYPPPWTNKLHEFELTQDPADRHDIRVDALARCRGPNKKGRVRAVSCRTSKQKFIGMQTVKKLLRKNTSETEDTVDVVRVENDTRFNELSTRLDKLEGRTIRCSTLGSGASRSIPNVMPTNLNQRFAHSSSIVPSPSICMYRICSTLSYDSIVVGSAAVTQSVGENVHGFRLKENETKLNVTMVNPGREDKPLYKGAQGGVSNIGDMIGNYIIWSTILLQQM